MHNNKAFFSCILKSIEKHIYYLQYDLKDCYKNISNVSAVLISAVLISAVNFSFLGSGWLLRSLWTRYK